MIYLFIGIGSGLGGALRYWVSGLIAGWIGQRFPWGTLVVNVTGSLAIGFVAALTGPDGRISVPGEWRQFFLAGICGGYTTFSSFSIETLSLARNGQWLAVGGNVLLSVFFCLLAVWIGRGGAMALGR